MDYATTLPLPDDSSEVFGSIRYLEACNKLYPNKILDNMEQGFLFFAKWLDSLLLLGMSH